MADDQHVFDDRLLMAAKAVREGLPENFNMMKFSKCGTPACVLGHYATRRDLQSAFRLNVDDDWIRKDDGSSVQCGIVDDEVLTHFDLSASEAEELFGVCGCGNARTNQDAAAYIEAFVSQRHGSGTYDQHVGPRTARARTAFTAWFQREPIANEFDARWIGGYVAALEDLPDELLSAPQVTP